MDIARRPRIRSLGGRIRLFNRNACSAIGILAAAAKRCISVDNSTNDARTTVTYMTLDELRCDATSVMDSGQRMWILKALQNDKYIR
jgi:hypothetical protein